MLNDDLLNQNECVHHNININVNKMSDDASDSHRTLNKESDTLRSSITKLNPFQILRKRNSKMEQEIKYWREEFEKLKNEVIVNLDHNTARDSIESENDKLNQNIISIDHDQDEDEISQYQTNIAKRKKTNFFLKNNQIKKLDLTKFNYDDMPENIKDDINSVILNDTAMMKQNSEIEVLINDIKDRKRTPRLN